MIICGHVCVEMVHDRDMVTTDHSHTALMANLQAANFDIITTGQYRKSYSLCVLIRLLITYRVTFKAYYTVLEFSNDEIIAYMLTNVKVIQGEWRKWEKI